VFLVALLVACKPIPRDDADTDAVIVVDADADGFTADVDCDDLAADVHPFAVEVCDGVDDDCDGVVDGGVLSRFWPDYDHDGFGAGEPVAACSAAPGFVADDSDCDDAAPAVNPAAIELCNGVDDDCDARVDQDAADAVTVWRDGDGDGFGDGDPIVTCDPPLGSATVAGDCDDTSSEISPAAVERCDDRDEDCNGTVDDAPIDPQIAYLDRDGDGYGDPTTRFSSCDPGDAVLVDGDCDDSDREVSPDGTERCGGADENCDGAVDEGPPTDAPTWYTDVDGDGWGFASVVACDQPLDASAEGGDCDDAEAAVYPRATEACNTVDDDCDGAIDESGARGESVWYLDADGDGQGDASLGVLGCVAPTGYVASASDCDDADASAYVGATEACDGDDEDCDGAVDEAGATGEAAWYADSDGDTYGDAAVSVTQCDAPTGYVAVSGDCNDAAKAVSPGATETCNDVDDDCDRSIDEAGSVGELTWYADSDGDTYGDPARSVTSCDAVRGYVSSAKDCDDGDASVRPGATETCDGVDEDCDGTVDYNITGLKFSASTDTVTLAIGTSKTLLALGSSYTLEAWVYRTAGGSGGTVFNKWEGGYEDKNLLISTDGTAVGYTYLGASKYTLTSTTASAVPTGDWAHLAWVVSGTTATFFVNGVSAATGTAGGDVADWSGKAQIGGIFRDSVQQPPVQGYLAEVRVSKTARYTSSFTPSVTLSSDTNTLGLWRLSEGTGTKATDTAGFANGTISGATWSSVICR
jgi:hypothetical protein